MSGAVSAEAPGSGFFEDREHCLPLRVYYEDTDAAGIVYYANYLRFAERGRSEFLRLAGIDQRPLFDSQDLAFAVRHASLDYRWPARLDDRLEVRSRLVRLGAASVEIAQRIVRDRQTLVTIMVKVACVALSDGKPKRLPAAVRTALEPFAQHATGESA
ncbi:acyl-CoA thioester hydrolase [Tistlia consotensis]|uniref:Acyl-CoA thioester hydrolase n=1 Tax=Tistlia consotensis USBA 355 TaxID=560819 RepID=A0A1Y6BWS4_9PROT|nr:tol-pal system-associated acyl-CoA thioesterase [Tistlia consotensis]SMF32710.1 acyl-CoA thioester hydrolase [Tistlia consotensis USBA 355]SNR68856.1 acyl-CoA thioester hydrolase [Tistlia consotensis]